ncbi:SGNH/GDSL hydrolase family protein [Rivularia sp. UHCC 0363]|uniref:SGNH/GDSL hydrolase family protein n=1 Tax=Rivularia sp. UHCC 0363 TaxID=3110244 RepID=UPI002B21C464|nr:SGNH/GDSL hydrolase family protein [Rivularia sp. UHCC 0363]MEA5595553.1 SGNH/GDSL hydrolase family protein [Rivularia sp. UHCC 0363]
MRLYLLAISLLIGLTVPTSFLPELAALNPQQDRLSLNRKNVLQATKVENTVSDSEISLSDFISQRLLPPAESSYNPPQAVRKRLISGSQLYYERLAALKAGYIYTRLTSDKLQSLLINRTKSKLTYQDWKSLLALEAGAMSRGQGNNRLSIMLGDSLSLWFPTSQLPNKKLWLNQGISGDTSTGVLKRISAISSTKPEIIYIMAGINDLRKGASDKVILNNHRQMIRSLKRSHPSSHIIIQSILPTRLPTIPNTRIRTINSQLASIAQEEGVNYIDLHKWFADFQGDLRQDLTTDGLHLSLEGYEVWLAAIQQIEEKLAISNVGSRE